MSLTFNMNGGGSKVFGTILVNYPAGATVSISPNAKYKDITTGQRVYYVKASGTYTVTATDGVDTKSEAVVISYDGQIVTVTLSFKAYIVQNGIEQDGVEFAISGRRYNSSTTAASNQNAYDHKAGYIKARSTINTGRGSTIFLSSSIKSVLGAYSYLNVRCQRYCTGGSNEFKLTLGTYYGTATNAVDNFLDAAPELVHTDDADVVTLQIPITSATTESEDVYFAVAWCCGTSGTFGIDIYDIYLTNEVLS